MEVNKTKSLNDSKIRNVKDGITERIIPEHETLGTYNSHLQRYIFASPFCQGKIILDIACGVGYGSNNLIESGAKKVVGVDISRDAIGYAKSNYQKDELEFVVSDGIALPFPEDMFDIIVSFETIEHIYDYKKYLSECKRVLKTNGILICSTPINFPFKKPNPHHTKEFNVDEFSKLLMKYFNSLELYFQGDESIIRAYSWAFISRLPDSTKCRIINIYKNLLISNDLSCVSGNPEIIPYKRRIFRNPTIIISICKK